MAYAISKFDHDFRCDSFVATNGVDFTLHAEKAQRFATFDDALRALRQFFPEASICSFPEDGSAAHHREHYPGCP